MSVEFKDYYATLGVPRNAGEDDIKNAFRKLARKYHPDVAKDKKAGEEKFKEINEAHEVLSDPQKRSRYDELGPNWKEGAAYQRPPGRQPGANYSSRTGQAQDFHFGGTGFSDFFEQVFGRGATSGFSSYGDGMDGRFGQSPVAARGSDIEADILVTLDEVSKGSLREISLQGEDPSSGQPINHRFKVRIPAGVHEGQLIRGTGKGGMGFGEGSPGDLYLRVRIAAHPDFRVRGADLYYDLDLTPWEGVLGTKIKIPTFEGQLNVRIPPGTNNGQKLRIPSHGLPQGKGKNKGDLYVTVDVRLPKTVNDEERALWEQLGKISAFRPRKISSP